MSRLRKLLLVAGTIFLLIFTAAFGYACYDEYSAREKENAPQGTDYGFIPTDLLEGRTKYEKRVGDRVLFSIQWGPAGEVRVAIARAGCGIGVLGAIVLAVGLPGNLPRSPRILAVIVLALAILGTGGYFVFASYFRTKVTTGPTVDVGATPDRKPTQVPEVKFTDVTESAGIRFTHSSGATGNKLLPETMGSGVVVLDFDNDRRPDLLFVNSRPWPGDAAPEKAPTLALYRNKGDGTFEDVTVVAGLNASLYGVGACAGDFDNDGFVDLFISCVGGHKLFRNIGGKRFEDVTANAGVAGPGVWPQGESAADFLKHAPPIPFGSSATFVDYDGDGKLDLFVCHYCSWSPAIDLGIKSTLTGVGRTYQQPTSLEGSQCSLYRNRGDGTFEDVSESAGVLVFDAEGSDAGSKKRAVGKSLGVILLDADGDGWPDLVVANDTVRNFFFHNQPDGKGGRKYVEKGMETNIAYAEASPRGAMGIDVGEYRPGRSALLIANFANEPTTFLVQNNPERLLFADACAAVGLYGPSRGPLKFGTFFFDCDLDGRLDILTANGHIDPDITKLQANQTYKQPAQLFWNTGEVGRDYEPVTAATSGPDLFKPLIARGSAYLDFDGDGDPDVVLTENGGPAILLRNDQKLGHHWLRLNLEGDGIKSNRSAIGAEVTVEAGGRTFKRTVAGARGYLSQSELMVTVGLGKTETIDKATVRWPGKNGGTQTWTGLKCDAPYRLKQGDAEARIDRPTK